MLGFDNFGCVSYRFSFANTDRNFYLYYCYYTYKQFIYIYILCVDNKHNFFTYFLDLLNKYTTSTQLLWRHSRHHSFRVRHYNAVTNFYAISYFLHIRFFFFPPDVTDLSKYLGMYVTYACTVNRHSEIARLSSLRP